MAYRDNVSKLASKLGISNDPGLREEDLKIAELRFANHAGEVVSVVATDMNRGGRLFFQDLTRDGHDKVVIDDALLIHAAEFFAELWEPNPEPGKRKLLDAICSSKWVDIIRK